MEAGLILPQPGEEAAWFEHNRAQLSALGRTRRRAEVLRGGNR
jgi:hypothetical protein